MTNENKVNIDENGICWEEFMSSKGKKYEVGYRKKDALSEEEKSKQELSGSFSNKKDFGISVNWPVGANKWIYTEPIVGSTAGITRYALYDYSGYYRYMLEFTNTEHYDYYFYDATGDDYRVNTYTNGDHYVRYDSSAPTILYIKGS